MSAETGKAVERYTLMPGGAEYLEGYYTMTPDSEGQYVRHEDYAKLEQQRDALVEALKPFAKLQLKPGWHDETPTAVLVTVGDIRRADAALKAAGEGLS